MQQARGDGGHPVLGFQFWANLEDMDGDSRQGKAWRRVDIVMQRSESSARRQ